MPDYLPTKQGELLPWGRNFSTLITATPVKYALTLNDATVIAAAVDAFELALTAATAPGTRTATTIAIKDERMAELIDVLRGYGMLIKSNNAVSEDDKVALGLGSRDVHPTPVPVPMTTPLVEATPMPGRRVKLNFRDKETPTSRAKPKGAVGLQLFCYTGETPPEDAAKCTFQRFCSRDNFMLNFDAPEVGKSLYVWARWQTGTGLTGAFSEPAVTTVPR